MKGIAQIVLGTAILLASRGYAADPQGRTTVSDRVQSLSEAYGPEWIEGLSNKPEFSSAIPGDPAVPETLWTKRPVQPLKTDFSRPSRVPERAVMPSLWLPMCFLFDPSVDAVRANEKIQGMAAAYADCGIALEPYAFTIKSNYPDDSALVGGLAMLACPLNYVFSVRAAIQIEPRSSLLAKQMCQDPAADGCSTLCLPLSLSIVKPNAGPQLGLHESMHSNCCGAVCVNQGEGGGIPAGPGVELASVSTTKKFQAAVAVKSREAIITKEGCQALRAGASPNGVTHWYDPDKKDYYVPQPDPARQFDLMAAKSFFPDPHRTSQPTEISAWRPPSRSTRVPSGPIRKLLEEISSRQEVQGMEPPLFLRAPATESAPTSEDLEDPIPKELVASEPIVGPFEKVGKSAQGGRPRERGGALRKTGDSTRKSSGSDIGFIDAYGGSAGGAGAD